MKRTLHEKEDYITPKTFMCEICAAPVLIGQKATLFIYTYFNTTFPAYFEEDEDIPVYDFKPACTSCGEHHND
jgi:hypothetical protein